MDSAVDVQDAPDVQLEVEVVGSSSPEGVGFLIKASASGCLFRVAPVRDPRQPRFWSIRVHRCTRAGVADPRELPWMGPGGMSREQLPDAFATIRADVGAWLAQPDCRNLRTWLLAQIPDPPAVPLAADRARSSREKAAAKMESRQAR